PGIHHHHSAGYFGYLLQAILAFDGVAFLVERVDIDHIARRNHLRHRGRRPAFRGARDAFGPFDAIERHNPGLPFLADGAATLARRLEADASRLIAGFQHHRHPPGRDVRQRFDVSELHAPIAGNIELGDRAAVALFLVILDEARYHGLARHDLDLRI